jgi:hypothetical protein
MSYLNTGPKQIERAIERAIKVIERGKRYKKNPLKDFTHIAVSGMSGMIVGPAIAAKLGKHLMIVRKPDDKGNHGIPIETVAGDKIRYIILDDFYCTGETIGRMNDQILKWQRKKDKDFMCKHDFKCVGVVFYGDKHNCRVRLSRDIDITSYCKTR